MATDDPITVLVLQEFRLRAADDAAAAARIVAASPSGIEPAHAPLLTSIEDGRDVATLRALHAGEVTEIDEGERAGLDHLVTSWAAPKKHGRASPSVRRACLHPSVSR